MSEPRSAPSIRHPIPWLVLTYGLGAVLLFFPLAFTIDGLPVPNTYAGTSDPTAQRLEREAMFGVALWGSVASIFVIGCAVVGGIIARQGGLNVFVVILVGVVLMASGTLPLAWLFTRPVGGA